MLTAAVAPKGFPVIPDEGALTVFVDGSSLSGPRRGGIGIRFVHVDRHGVETVWDSPQGGVERGTNNQMELLAVITALKELQHRRFRTDLLDAASKIDIYTDSQYVVDNLNRAIFEWSKQGWMTKSGPPVQNAELWQELVRELIKLKKLKRVEVKWGKGHSANNPHNKAVDALAKESAKRPTRTQLVPGTVRRKTSTQQTEAGSVAMLGQRLQIRIVSADYLAPQKINRYRYEVVSPHSAYHGKVDFAYSDDAGMRPGHIYVVTMNRDQQYPMIAKRHREVVQQSDSHP
jgi:ribonuclease HI